MGNSTDYIFACPEAEILEPLAAQYDGKFINIRIADILQGISDYVIYKQSELRYYPGIPKFDGTFHILLDSELSWLSEDFDVMHSNIEISAPIDQELGKDFLRGYTISWKDLDAHFDADREITEKLEEIVKVDLDERTTARFNLYHWPGAGGTTLGRRLAWNLHRKYPTIILKRVTPDETIGRFRMLFQYSSQSILAIIEGSNAIADRLEKLFNEAKAEQLPIIFVLLLRRFDNINRDKSDRAIYLTQTLSFRESRRFTEIYSRFLPDKSSLFEKIVNGNDKDRTPFQFALSGFGRDYVGLNNYVASRLQGASPIQRDILAFIALAYYYGHKAIFAQTLAQFLGFRENLFVRLETVLTDLQRELLIVEEKYKWRPAHQLIAEEIIRIVLSGASADIRNWKHALSTWSIRFIDAIHPGTIIHSDDLIDLMRRIFVLRDEHELLGTEGAAANRFSLLIEDIPSQEGRLSVFKKLVESFPEEAHFWGHLGRFQSTVMNEPFEALISVNRAIGLQPKDPVLHHMKGMIFRSIIYQLLNEYEQENPQPLANHLPNIHLYVDEAKSAFLKARELDQSSEYAYISPIQMLLRILDYGHKLSGIKSRAEFFILPSSKWYQEQLDELENLMDQVRSLREGDRPSKYILECQSKLDIMYDNYSRALEGWQNLLVRPDVYAPPIRRLITKTYLGRADRTWSRLKPNEIEWIVDNMEANILEEPASSLNIKLWLQAIRYSSRQDIDVALDKLAIMKAQGNSLEAYYYTYVLHVLKAIGGSSVEREKSRDLIQESKDISRNNRNRTRSFEWLGGGKGLRQIVHYTDLGEWNPATKFYHNVKTLRRIEGYILEIRRPEYGIVRLSSCDLDVFFVPAILPAFKGRDENRKVTFFLGFSYDGLRAWATEYDEQS